MGIPVVDVNWWAVIVSTFVSMILGTVWYSPLFFGNVWAHLNKADKKIIAATKRKGVSNRYLIVFASTLVMTYILAQFTVYVTASTLSDGLQLGFWVWLGFFATTLLGSVLWEGKPFKLYLLNTGYYLVNLLVVGAILAVWH